MLTARVHRIPVPNPFFEGRNSVYLIASSPVTLIDTGVATTKAFEALEAGLKEHGLRVGDIQRVVLTHKHIDHMGNAWRIQQQGGAEILIHESECHAVTDVDPSGERFAELVAKRLREWGAPEMKRSDRSSSPMPPWDLEPAEATGLSDGQYLEQADGRLQVIHTPGHTMGSICLRYGTLLFSGDHVLEDLSPNIGGGDMRHRGVLRHYLASLERIMNTSDEVQVMPGHGQPFTALRKRCQVLIGHHEERLAKILVILRGGPQSVYEVACQLFGKLESFHVMLGCAEASAHLELLVERGSVACDDGEYRLTAA